MLSGVGGTRPVGSAAKYSPPDQPIAVQVRGGSEARVSVEDRGAGIAPEGTRSPDGRLQPFKRGVFVMAIKAGAPIVPVSVSGSARIMRKGEFAIHPGVMHITFHDAVPNEGCDIKDRARIILRPLKAVASVRWRQTNLRHGV